MAISSISPTLMKVLVVDDIEDNVELIKQILEDDCNVIPAYSGAECIEKALSENPSLILLDVNMPTMDGYETMLKLQQNNKTQDIPVIFASAYYKEAAMIVKGLELGAFDYLTKPIDEDILLAKVRVVKRIKFAEEMLSRSQKMDALGKLTGGIAHDYNNMLGIVLGYASLLSEHENVSGHPQLSKFADEITRAANRGAKLTSKLLSFSRKHSAQEERTNINTLLLDEQHMLEKTLTARIKLTFNLADDLWPVYIESSEMVDVILNMSINAMHAMEDSTGTLIFKTSNVKINKADSLWLQKDVGDYILLNITDNGSGMSEAMKEKIFDPFFSTKGDKGTGLGLSQVYGFVERSGGAIYVYSELGIGTSFSLYFPRDHTTESTDDKSHDEENTNHISLKGTESILVVDDEPALLSFLREILCGQGYNILSAENAEQALKILEMESVDLLISDVIMPGIDGYQLAKIVQHKYPNVKIQLASGFTDNLHLNTIDKQLHKNLLHKPFDSELLLKRVRHLLLQ